MPNKTARMVFLVEPEFQDKVTRFADGQGIPYSEVCRRALANWIITGELPPKMIAGDQLEKQRRKK